MGVVAVYTTSGTFIRTAYHGRRSRFALGITLAPAGFGAFGGDLLVGNFSASDSEINAFNARPERLKARFRST